MPRYSLNPHLLHATIEPPVALARSWAASFPLESSPCPQAPLLNLAQGVPGHDPPASFVSRLRSKITHGYGDVFGLPSLREALARDLSSVYAGDVSPDDIAITAGANLAFAVVAQTVAAKDDVVMVPTPWYFNHYMTLSSLGIRTHPVATCSTDFLLASSTLRAEIDEVRRKHGAQQPKALVIVTPNNPTGAVYSSALLAEHARICAESGVALILDETYRDFLVDSRPHDLFQGGDWRDSLIHISSFSKSYAIPGHRLGAIACHPTLLLRDGHYGPIAKALDNLQICPPVNSTQDTVAWAIHDPEHMSWRVATAKGLETRRSHFKNLVESVPGWAVKSMGAYYAYVRHPWAGHVSSETVARALAGLIGVVVLPGSFFCDPNSSSTQSAAECLRFSVANIDSHRLDVLPHRLRLFAQHWSPST